MSAAASVMAAPARPKAAPSYDDLLQRLRLIQEGIDWLLGNPKLTPSARELALLTLRQTVLFGKESDQITVRQQAQGIRNLNRGTGRHPKTLQRARRQLRAAGFWQESGRPGDNRGRRIEPNFSVIRREVSTLRTKELNAPGASGAKCSPHQSYRELQNLPELASGAPVSEIPKTGLDSEPLVRRQTDGSERRHSHRLPARLPRWKDSSIFVSDEEAGQMAEFASSVFSSVSKVTAIDLIRAARGHDKAATVEQIKAAISVRLSEGSRIEQPGGLLIVLNEDFPKLLAKAQVRLARYRATERPKTAIEQPAAPACTACNGTGLIGIGRTDWHSVADARAAVIAGAAYCSCEEGAVVRQLLEVAAQSDSQDRVPEGGPARRPPLVQRGMSLLR